MARVLLDVTMSLDGFTAGPGISAEHPMGEGGLRLHDWILTDPPDGTDAAIVAEMRTSTGAVVLGRRTFDVGIGVWNDTPYPAPSFVLTHRPRAALPQDGGTFHFVPDVRTAWERATEAAGSRDVRLMGADVGRQFLAAGLVDEIRVQLAPVLLVRGRRLFEDLGTERIELDRLATVDSPRVTHLRYGVHR